MKKKGDLKIKPVADISRIIDEMANGLEEQPPRLKAFWNYKPLELYMGRPSFTTVAEDGFFRTKKKIKAIVGGNRSVKTYTAIFELLMIYTGIVPPALQGIYPWEQTLKDCLPAVNTPEPVDVA